LLVLAERLRQIIGQEAQHVEMDADQPGWTLRSQLDGHRRTPVANLCHITRITDPRHEFGPCPRDALDPPAAVRRLFRESVTGQRRQHEVEGIVRATAVRGRVDQGHDK
jgi:hypothetical protein